MPEIMHFSWDNNRTPIWIEDAFPDDVTELLISNETDEVMKSTSKKIAKLKKTMKKKR